MVAQERMKVADLEAELRESASEREALKLAMRILEEENQRFRTILTSPSQAVRELKTATPTQRLTPSPSHSHSRSSSSSSLFVPNVAAPDSPHANLQNLTSVEPLPSVANGIYPEEAMDLVTDRETVQPQRVTRSPPPPLEVDCWPDSPDTAYYTSAPPETADPDEDETTVRLITR